MIIQQWNAWTSTNLVAIWHTVTHPHNLLIKRRPTTETERLSWEFALKIPLVDPPFRIQMHAHRWWFKNPANHLGCIKLCKQWAKVPTSTGDRRISSINSITGFVTTTPMLLSPGPWQRHIVGFQQQRSEQSAQQLLRILSDSAGPLQTICGWLSSLKVFSRIWWNIRKYRVTCMWSWKTYVYINRHDVLYVDILDLCRYHISIASWEQGYISKYICIGTCTCLQANFVPEND